MKQCIACFKIKSVKAFSASLKHKDKLQNKCKVCSSEYAYWYYRDNKEISKKRTREHNYKKYKMTEEKILKEKIKRNAICDICTRKFEIKRLVPDHCHKNMKFRGILCYKCNSNLGWYEIKKTEILEYLIKSML